MADTILKRWNPDLNEGSGGWEELNPQTTHTQIVASGTPSSTTFLRGDGTWATPEGGGGDVQTVNGVSPDANGEVTLSASDVGALSKTYRDNWITVNYGSGGVGYWQKIATINFVNPYSHYNFEFDWATRGDRGTANVHIRTTNIGTTPQVVEAWISSVSATGLYTLDASHLRTKVVGDKVEIYNYVGGWVTFNILLKDSITEAPPSSIIIHTDFLTAQTTTEPSGTSSFQDRRIWNKSNFNPSNYIPTSEKGANSGVATLDSSGKLTNTQIPDYLIGGLKFVGALDLSANNKDLQDLATELGNMPDTDNLFAGSYWIVSAAGGINAASGFEWQEDGAATPTVLVWDDGVQATNNNTDVQLEVGDWVIVTSYTYGGTVSFGVINNNDPRFANYVAKSGDTMSGNLLFSNGDNRFIRFGSATNYFYQIGSVNDDFQINEAGSTNNRLTIKYPNGNVGIGTTSPSEKLNVDGGIRLDADVDLNIGYYTDITTKGYGNLILNNHGDFVFGLNLKPDGEHDLVSEKDHPVIAGSAIVLGGNDHPNGTNTINFYSKPAVSTTAGTVYTAESAEMVLKQGNLGIGTTSPSYKLDINNASNYTHLRLGGAGAPLIKFAQDSFNSGNGAELWQQDGKFYLNIRSDLNAMVVDTSANVGIGTSSPATKLDVNGVIRNFQGSGGMTLSGYSTPDFGYLGYNYYNNNGTEAAEQAARDSWRIQFGNGSVKTMAFGHRQPNAAAGTFTDYMTITNAGNVGIGTASPADKLTVTDGNIRIFNTGGIEPTIYFSHYNVSSSYPQSAIRVTDDGSWGGHLNFLTKPGGASTNTLQTRMRINANGNVGIGTTSPAYKVEAVGKGWFWEGGGTAGNQTGTIIIGGQNTSNQTWYTTSIRTINDGSSPAYLRPRMGFFTQGTDTYLFADQTEKMSILSDNGYVGIGTTTPQAKLDVNGELKASNIHDWQWRWIRYSSYTAPAGASAYQLEDWFKTYFLKTSAAPADSGYLDTRTQVGTDGGFGGSNYGNMFGDLDGYSAHIYTQIYVDRQFSVSITNFSGDDPYALFIDEKFVQGNNSCCTNMSYNYTFTRGWHKIDLIYAESGGGDWVRLGWNPKDYLAYITDMNPYKGIERTLEGQLTIDAITSVKGSNPIYFGQSTNSLNSWTTRQLASGSTHLYNAQAHTFNNDGYGSTWSHTLDANGMSLSNNSRTIYGPNSTWSRYLAIGGDGAANNNAITATVATTNGNLHIDAAAGGFGTYLNFYAGTGGVRFGGGNATTVAVMGPDGDLWKGNDDNTGFQYWHAGNLSKSLTYTLLGSITMTTGSVTMSISPSNGLNSIVTVEIEVYSNAGPATWTGPLTAISATGTYKNSLWLSTTKYGDFYRNSTGTEIYFSSAPSNTIYSAKVYEHKVG